MPGTVFLYEGKRYDDRQITNGKYYRAYDQEKNGIFRL